MHYPLYIVSGGAGSGKDTVAEMMITGRRGVMVAQADPMKRFAMAAFGFSFDQLWGPSSSRNAADERYSSMKEDALWGSQAFAEVVNRVFNESDVDGLDLATRWLQDISPESDDDAIDTMRVMLNTWLSAVSDQAVKDQKLSPRTVLQLLGTEFGRNIDPNIWSNYAIRAAKKLLLGEVGYSRELGLIDVKGLPGYNFVVITDGRFRNEILNVKEVGGVALKITNPATEADERACDAAGVKGHVSEAELKGIPWSWFDTEIHNDKTLGLDYLRARIDEMMKVLFNGLDGIKDLR